MLIKTVNVKEAAEILKCSTRTVWRLVKAGLIRQVKSYGNKAQLRLDDVELLNRRAA